jgi:hypothetical protein
MRKKRSAIPEYLWYVGLIVLSVILIMGIAKLVNSVERESSKKVQDQSMINKRILILYDPNFVNIKKYYDNLKTYCNIVSKTVLSQEDVNSYDAYIILKPTLTPQEITYLQQINRKIIGVGDLDGNILISLFSVQSNGQFNVPKGSKITLTIPSYALFNNENQPLYYVLYNYQDGYINNVRCINSVQEGTLTYNTNSYVAICRNGNKYYLSFTLEPYFPDINSLLKMIINN